MNKLKLFILFFAAFAQIFAQSKNTIDNDGTTADRWYIGIDSLAKAAVGISQYVEPSNNLTIGDKLNVGSQTFASGWQTGTGWKLDWTDTTDYTLELDNLNIRGTLSAYEFLVDQIRATNGDVFISSTAKVNWWNGYNKIRFEDITGLGVAPFAAGDIIMCQQVTNGATFDANGDINNNSFLIKRLIYKVDSVKALDVYYSILAGAPANKSYPKNGDVFVRIGNVSNAQRQGSIGFYTDVTYEPYIRIVNNVNSWASWKDQSNIVYQAGNLQGISDPDFGGQLEGYGLYTQNAYIKGKIIITNPQQVADSLNNLIRTSWDSVNNKPTYFNAPNGSGLFLSATNMGYYNAIQYPADPWRTYMDNQGRFYLKGNSGNYLTWDGNGLYINGNFSGNGNALNISANSTISNIYSTLSTHSTQITQNANEISLRAYQTDMTRAFDTLTVHRTAITQNATSISLKANKTYVDSLNNRLTNAETNITQNANAITLKANIISVDSLKTRMQNAEAEIVINTSNINNINSNLLLYAKRDSIISYINLSPDSIRISGDKIILDGNVNVQGTFSINQRNIRVDSLSQINDNLGAVRASYINAGSIVATGLFSIVGISMGFNYEFNMQPDYFSNSIIFNYPIKPTGYKASDGTDGATANITGLQFKNGIYVGGNFNASATWGSISGTLSNQSDLQTTLDGKANTSGTYPALSVGYAFSAGSVTWDNVSNKPSTYPPSLHTHTDLVPISRTITINGITYDLSADRSWAVTASSVDWANITNKPSTFPPSTHAHGNADITDLAWSKLTGVPTASSTTSGILSSTDWNTFNNKVPTSRTISTSAPLSGGGDLSANRTIGLAYSSPLTVYSGYLTILALPQSLITNAWGTSSTFSITLFSGEVLKFYYQPLTIGGTTKNIIYNVEYIP